MQENDTTLLLSIIIPAYNEEEAITETVQRIKETGLTSYEIIVIDDGSTDFTAENAQRAGARVISHPYNIGNGAAIKTGIRNARGQVILCMDGDGQHKPEDIPRFFEHIQQYHMVVGARTKGSTRSLHRTIANYIYNTFASFIAEFKIEDLTSGFRAMRREDALRFCDMFPNKFSYPTTSTLAFIRSGRSVKYIPIISKARKGKSKIKLLKDGFEFLIIIMKIGMMFSPLRVFLPIASFLFFTGIGRYIYTYLEEGRFTGMSHLLINTSVIVFMLGLIAEQIASLRFERGDKVFYTEDNSRYHAISHQLLQKSKLYHQSETEPLNDSSKEPVIN
jgi:glycosyltransferase involved in cell wall biosynthesis